MFSKEGITLGEFGLFVIIAYATGQLLLQAVVEAVGWHAERARAHRLQHTRARPADQARRHLGLEVGPS
jgi:hypothetical protein